MGKEHSAMMTPAAVETVRLAAEAWVQAARQPGAMVGPGANALACFKAKEAFHAALSALAAPAVERRAVPDEVAAEQRLPEIPDDPWKAFAVLVSRCANGLATELTEQGKTLTQARNAVIGCFLDMAAGEACRVAREEGREPDPEKWSAAVGSAFERAVKRTAIRSRAGGDAQGG